ncbi:MAG: URC4/urg3 family protein, partial [Halobacteriovoraceae bacterium]|nr:URC4/urg3 family protein [Halobacteriovoraceae bacterium]
TNPLLGIEGRVSLLRNLGDTIVSQPELFPNGKASGLLISLEKSFGKKIQAPQLLKAILVAFGDIWPGRINFQGRNLGDVWHYEDFGPASDSSSLIPFHKLSQWLSYSLFPAFRHYGFEILEQEKLTGLPEYRNGGLFLDTGLIQLRDPIRAKEEHPADSPLIIEWRALTVTLLDQLAPKLRERMKMPDFPMANILEGGTWWAGRYLSKELRPDGVPPLKLKSDGTVF